MQDSGAFRTAVIWVVVLLMAGAAVGVGATPDEAGQARLSPVIGPEFRVSDAATARHEQDPVAAWSETSRRYLIVWDAPAGIMVRRMTADAARLTRLRRASSRAAVKPACPAVAWNASNNEFLVVWRDDRNSATRGSDVYGRRLTARGKPIGGDIRISGIGAIADEGCPDVAWSASGDEYLVAWGDERHDATHGRQVWGRRLAANGSFPDRDFRVSRRSVDGHPAVAANSTAGQFLVVWAAERYTTWGIELDVRGRRVDVGAGTLGKDFLVDRTGEFAETGLHPDLAWDGANNRYLVVWDTGSLNGRVLAADGTRLSRRFRIGTAVLYNDSNPVVAWDRKSGRYLVTWMDQRKAATRGPDLWGRLVAPHGARFGSAFRVCGPGGTDSEIWQAVAANPTNGEFLVVWEDHRAYPPAALYGRRVAS